MKLKKQNEERVCIYCNETDKVLFTSREHVIPQCFGTFGSKTPTLHCVCDDCNAYFKKELDQALARDTLEGITRYTKGISSRERRLPKSLKFELDESEEYGGYSGALAGGYDPLTGAGIPIIPQFWIRNIRTESWEKYRIDQIKNLVIDEDQYGSRKVDIRQMKIIAPSNTEYNQVIEELKKYNIPFKTKEMLKNPPELENAESKNRLELRGSISGIIDKSRKRAFVKVLFNFATYYLGTEETLKSEWNKSRNFVRYDGDTLLSRISQEPFWTGQETKNIRFVDDSYNLRIENKGGKVVGVIQFLT